MPRPLTTILKNKHVITDDTTVYTLPQGQQRTLSLLLARLLMPPILPAWLQRSVVCPQEIGQAEEGRNKFEKINEIEWACSH